MDIMLRLTIRYLKLQRRRTLGIILGIAMAAFFLTVCLLFVLSSVNELMQFKDSSGDTGKLLQATSILLAVTLAAMTVFIYHVLSLSANERIRELGILGSVGATPFQRGRMMIYEAFLFCVVSLPIGLAGGLAVSPFVIPFPLVISWRQLLALLFFESLVVMATGLVQAYLSSRNSVKHLLLNSTEKRNLSKGRKLPAWMKRMCSLDAQMAIKNIYFYRRRCLMIGLTLVLSMVLLLDGRIYLNYMDGRYEPKDDRVRTFADISIRTFDQEGDSREIDAHTWTAFAQEIAKLEEVEASTTRKNYSLGGVIFKKENIKKEFHDFSTYDLEGSYQNPITVTSHLEEEKGYYMDIDLVVLDDTSFQKYAEKTGAEIPDASFDTAVPVIIDDTALIDSDEGAKYQGFLDIQKNEMFTVTADRERINYGKYVAVNEISEFVPLQFQALAVTEKPFFFLSDVTDIVLRRPNTVYFYTTQEYADQLWNTTSLSHTPEDTSAGIIGLKIKSDVSLPERIVYPAIIYNFQESAYYGDLKLESIYDDAEQAAQLQEKVDQQYELIIAVEKKIRKIGDNYGLKCYLFDDPIETDFHNQNYSMESYLTWVDTKLRDPYVVFRQLFTYTIMSFLIIMIVFQMLKLIVSSINMRKREFAVLLSMGMERGQVRKMVCLESIFSLSLSFLVGAVISIGIGILLFCFWSSSQALNVEFPYYIFLWELLFFLILTILSVVAATWNMRNIRITDMIKRDAL